MTNITPLNTEVSRAQLEVDREPTSEIARMQADAREQLDKAMQQQSKLEGERRAVMKKLREDRDAIHKIKDEAITNLQTEKRQIDEEFREDLSRSEEHYAKQLGAIARIISARTALLAELATPLPNPIPGSIDQRKQESITQEQHSDEPVTG